MKVTTDPILRMDFDKRNDFLELSSFAPAVCFQCGTCTATCPWSELLDTPMTVRKMIHKALLGLDTDPMLWFCTTCRMCETRCPREVDIVKSLLAMRKMAFRKRQVPAEFEQLLWNVLEEGNPMGDPLSARANWASDLNLRDASKGVDVLLYTGCASSYDPRIQKVARSLAAILGSTGMDFGILGTKELCCGDSVRSTGEDAFMETLIEKNVEAFSATGASRIVTISPHCYDMFNGLYKEYGMEIEILHHTELIAELWNNGALNMSQDIRGKGGPERIVTYHDPCYLGRYHGIYDAPRGLLEGIKGLQCTEMADCRENALCCGGGGGRMWLETEPGARQSDLRIGQATRTGADTMVTACPYCIQNFEDSTKVLESNIRVMDIAEIVAEASGVSPRGDAK
jgi:Fe-S oxidoreductase